MSESDALFLLPLGEFTAARNALQKKLKQAGRDEDAERVKALAKPSVSAWAVNQVYWKHRREFDALLQAGARLGKAHASQLTGKSTDVHGPLAARREAVNNLLNIATALLSDAGHNPSPDLMRRIATTLESLSASSQAGESPQLGRLTEDVAPLGFESMVALVAASSPNSAPPRIEKRTAKQAALEEAEQNLREVRAHAESTGRALTEASAQAGEKEKAQERAEEQLAKARTAAQEAHRRLKSLEAEAERAGKAVQSAEIAVQKARTELKQR